MQFRFGVELLLSRQRIQVICREVWYHKAHTIQEEISHADGWESDKEDDETTERTFWGYIVELKDVVVKPLAKSDDNSN